MFPGCPADFGSRRCCSKSRPGTGEVQIHVSGITLRYKSRNYVDRDKHAEKWENTIIFLGLFPCISTFSRLDCCFNKSFSRLRMNVPATEYTD